MDDILLNLIVLAGFILIAAVVFWLVRRYKSRKKLAIARMAATQGWQFETIREPLAWGTRLKSDHWTMVSISRSGGVESGPDSSEIALSTTWHADNPGSTILIGPKTTQTNLGEFGDVLIRKILQTALESHADGLVEVRAGSDQFRENFMVWAQEPGEVERLLNPALQSILMSWKGKAPVIKRTTEGLKVELRGVRIEQPDEILAIVRLGELLIAEEV